MMPHDENTVLVFAALLDVVEIMLLVNVRGSFQQTIES